MICLWSFTQPCCCVKASCVSLYSTTDLYYIQHTVFKKNTGLASQDISWRMTVKTGETNSSFVLKVQCCFVIFFICVRGSKKPSRGTSKQHMQSLSSLVNVVTWCVLLDRCFWLIDWLSHYTFILISRSCHAQYCLHFLLKVLFAPNTHTHSFWYLCFRYWSDFI